MCGIVALKPVITKQTLASFICVNKTKTNYPCCTRNTNLGAKFWKSNNLEKK